MKYFFAYFLCLILVLPAKAQKIFRYNQTGGITSLDPAFANIRANVWATSQLYNGLFSLNNALEPKPELVEDWTVSEDGLAYTFRLRKHIHFHANACFHHGKGRELVAEDVVFSLQRLFKTGTGAWVLQDKVLAKPNGSPADTCIKAVNKHTVRIYLKRKCSQMLFLLATPYCFIVPHEAVEHYKTDFGKNPVGTGAFKFQKWEQGQKMTLAKNEHYWERDYKGNLLPYLDGIEITFADDRNVEFLEFSNKKLHFIANISETSRDQILEKNGKVREAFAKRYTVQKMPYLNTEYIGFYVGKEANTVLLDAKLRQALAYAVDRQALLAHTRNNIGKPAEYGFAPSALPSFDSTKLQGYAYDLKHAKQLLAEAGFPAGKGLPTLTLHTYPSDKNIAEHLAKDWEHLGVHIKVEFHQFSTHRALVGEGKTQIFRGSWIADYPDAENYLALGYSKNFSPAGPNFFHFKSEEYDKLYEEASTSAEQFKRFDDYVAMDNLLIQNAVVIPLYYDEVVHITQKEVENLEVNSMNTLVLKYADLVPVRKRDRKNKK